MQDESEAGVGFSHKMIFLEAFSGYYADLSPLMRNAMGTLLRAACTLAGP
jgi:hypothetical protein